MIKDDAGGTVKPTHQLDPKLSENDIENNSDSAVSEFHKNTSLGSERNLKQRALKTVESNVATIIMTLLTVVALFMDDLRLSAFPKSADTAFVVLTVIIFVAFICEFLILSTVKKQYLFSFFFCLDLIAALSLIPDMPFIWDAISASSNDATADSLTITRAARASRAGTKIGRVLRFVRLIRLVRIAKLSELCMRKRQRVQPDIHQQQESNLALPTSKVGDHLSEKTTRRVVTMVLVMLFAVPALQVETEDLAPMLGLRDLQNLSMLTTSELPIVTSSQFEKSVFAYLNHVSESDSEWRVLFLHVSGDAYSKTYSDPDISSYRSTETKSIYISDDALALFSTKEASQLGAVYSILLTTFICFLLTVGALLFSKDANSLVIRPIERMVAIIEKLRQNPLPKKSYGVANVMGDGESLETGVLENTLEKLTGLLQVGFGEAGSTIIQNNINSEGELNPMVDGKRMLAIFGFVSIRNFNRINEVLGEDTLLFVNEVADLVHSEVHRLGGAANRNLGEAFLVVWRLPQLIPAQELQDLIQQQLDCPTDANDIEDITPVQMMAIRETQRLATQALSAFIRILCGCKPPSSRFHKFSNNPKLREAIPDFQVSLSCGLHVGWAIEGAIGSKFKIDASYLSPHVNTTARLMAATNQYNVSLLMSNTFWSILSGNARERCRMVDRAAVKGSNQPIILYTFDINHSMVMSSDLNVRRNAGVISMRRSDIERRRLEFKTTSANSVYADFDSNSLLVRLQSSTPKEFQRLFAAGIEAYLLGDWNEAEEKLSSAMRFKPDDGPAQTLLTYMSLHGGKAPEKWEGYRALTTK